MSVPTGGAQPQAANARVAIVDDEPGVRRVIRCLISRCEGLECAGDYESAHAALDAIPESRVHVVLMDIRLPGVSGFECLKQLKVCLPSVEVVMVSAMADQATVVKCLRAGAINYLVKPFSAAQFRATMEFVRAGLSCGNQSAGGSPCQPWVEPAGLPTERAPLTRREWDVLTSLSSGRLYKETASELGIGEDYVKQIAHTIYVKLRVRNRSEAAAWLALRRRAPLAGSAADSTPQR